MTNSVQITKVSAADAIALKIELAHAGLVVDRDYTWRFQPVKYSDSFSSTLISDSQVTFEFVEPAVASFYRLKWA